MSTTRAKIVAQAQSWIGSKESDGSHRKIIDIYNGHKPLARGYKVLYTDPWCATFVSACAIACGATDIIPTECSCTKLIELFKAKGIWVENDAHVPTSGDILLYDWQDSGKGDNTGTPDHIGIVEKVENGFLTIIEGNLGNAVSRRQLQINGRYIRGYAVPKYAEEAPVAPTAPPAGKTVEELALECLDGKWGNGADRKQRLTSAGHDYSAVQTRVNELVKTGKTIAELAKEVRKGNWGNGTARKKALASAGYSPATIKSIQDKVNEYYK